MKTDYTYKDSERPAPESVQSTNFQPIKRAKGVRAVHAHGTVSHEPATPDPYLHQDPDQKVTDEWKMRIELNRSRKEGHDAESYTYEELQMDLAAVIDDDAKEQQRSVFFSHVDDRPAGSKRQRSVDAPTGDKVTRRGLREILTAQTVKLRIQKAGLEVQPNAPGIEKTETKRRKGDDAITRLLNTGIGQVSDRAFVSRNPRSAGGSCSFAGVAL